MSSRKGGEVMIALHDEPSTLVFELVFLGILLVGTGAIFWITHRGSKRF